MSRIEVVYSDNTIVVVNKPPNLLSVPGRGPDKKDSVIWRLQREYPTARIVHRLDCATSGLMVLALSADSHRELSRQFHDREVSKRYQATVSGHLEADNGEVALPLITDWPNRPKQKVDFERGKNALTHFSVLQRITVNGVPATKVALTPVTGRTHQLRVHMLSLGHPILGDRLYAEGEALTASERLLLHAEYIRFTHPETTLEVEHEFVASF